MLAAKRGRCVIKGPGHRLKFDVRRVWVCPACGKRVRCGGHVVNRRCDCGAAAWMKLVEEPRSAGKKGDCPLEEGGQSGSVENLRKRGGEHDVIGNGHEQ